jgi:hypothetical protein
VENFRYKYVSSEQSNNGEESREGRQFNLSTTFFQLEMRHSLHLRVGSNSMQTRPLRSDPLQFDAQPSSHVFALHHAQIRLITGLQFSSLSPPFSSTM